ncbi:hypothetical protein DFA_05955 [Cavenderia fasciculata]|uniref:Secreted protein n=1 Tax=Cavenderia fasciculata TaxID=261658 RepID=F4PJP5_CACFS|nr:uncharacterized protein DFA_05955 [Cavenderia fasciculata]EGG23819.1 hypothetical protein DFA_05955 [Cavenderia fasciculata]|eukprot:XP_004361670.1 hypothetical protein DFA_05955 [Cavenderia fasciculata]
MTGCHFWLLLPSPSATCPTSALVKKQEDRESCSCSGIQTERQKKERDWIGLDDRERERERTVRLNQQQVAESAEKRQPQTSSSCNPPQQHN